MSDAHHGPFLGTGNVRQAKGVPNYNVLIYERLIVGGPFRQSFAGMTLIRIGARCIQLIGMVLRDPEMIVHKPCSPAYRRISTQVRDRV